jgi:DNA-binding transcriptional LysR family regulator
MLVSALQSLGTVHKAAQALHISQPAASAMLTDLEGFLGFALFERSHRGVQLTTNGGRLLDKVRLLLNDFDDFGRAIERVRQGDAPVLRVGLVPQAYATYLPSAIESFRRTGGAMIRAEEGTARQLLESLLAGNLDCVIGRLPATDLPSDWDVASLSFKNLYSEEICIVAGALSRVLDDSPCTFGWLASQQWVLQRRDSSVRMALNEAFLRNGVTPPTPIIETTNYMQSLALAAKSTCYTVAPRRAAKAQEALGLATVVDIDLGVSPMQVSFIQRNSDRDTEQIRLFHQSFREAVADCAMAQA